ncbi:MAG: hypothetical protein LKJ31_06370 [Atopobiaceae bacterium]|jgi:hypothetical protein|nr:hypothetical protein [Atopobiaceae bacterium]
MSSRVVTDVDLSTGTVKFGSAAGTSDWPPPGIVLIGIDSDTGYVVALYNDSDPQPNFETDANGYLYFIDE